ncbi:MAG: HupE/UreJ family protein, partial [Roseimicrobium sp.]
MKASPTPSAPWATRHLILCAAFVPSLAQAHANEATAGGLVSGFVHPLTGADHLVAMLAVGLWGAQLGRPLLWVLPIAFPALMAVGGVLGIRGVPLPMVELGVALSAVFLGGAVASAARPPRALAVALVGGFALFHGHAHGAEMPVVTHPAAFGLGFIVATGVVHG